MKLRPFAIVSACTLACGGALALGNGAHDNAAHERIDATYKADSTACAQRSGNAKDVCMAEATGKRNVARAELEAAQRDTPRSRAKVAEEKAEAAYKVAKERCDDLAGNAKDVCVADANAQHERAKADAKAQARIGEARSEARADARDAEYKAAKERCDSYAGDAKDRCISDLKARYGK
jgi:hypothetical protein